MQSHHTCCNFQGHIPTQELSITMLSSGGWVHRVHFVAKNVNKGTAHFMTPLSLPLPTRRLQWMKWIIDSQVCCSEWPGCLGLCNRSGLVIDPFICVLAVSWKRELPYLGFIPLCKIMIDKLLFARREGRPGVSGLKLPWGTRLTTREVRANDSTGP